MESNIDAESLFFSALEDIKNKFYKEAELKLQKAYLKIPKKKSIILNLSSVLIQLEKFDEAIKILDEGIKTLPEDIDLLLNKSLLLIIKKDTFAAIKLLLKITKINQEISIAYFRLAHCWIKLGYVEKAIKNFRKCFDLSPRNEYLSNIIFYLNFSENYSDNEYINLINKFEFFAPKIKTVETLKFDFKITKKINIGFVSGDLKENHPVGNFLYDFLNNLREYFELYAYYNDEEDERCNNFKKLFNKWENIKEIKDIDVVNLIKKQKINILVDLSGHTAKNRLNIFANKAAPIQITWCGYLNSTGISEIDYIIGDPYVTPKKDQFKYTEKILQMPKIWNCYSKPSSDTKIIIESPLVKNKYVTFGSFNQLNKLNNNVIKLWSKIILHLKTAKLLLIAAELDNEKAKSLLYKKFLNLRINKEQIIMKGRQPRNQLLLEYNNIDIALDPFPYNGGSTSFECAYMGVPLLTMKGERFLSNCGESINANLGMHEWIAKNKNDYYEKAIKFSENTHNLNLTRKNLHSKAINSPLFNSKEFAKNFSEIIKKLNTN
jgi:predicted O-linked N-acetylglucosamine transferase (SPINDLY family)